MREIHVLKGRVTKVECKICKRKVSKKTLSVHMKNMHIDRRTYECSFCGRTLTTKVSLKVNINH